MYFPIGKCYSHTKEASKFEDKALVNNTQYACHLQQTDNMDIKNSFRFYEWPLHYIINFPIYHYEVK